MKFTSLDVLTLCFNEKLPAAGNLASYSEGNDIKRFSPTDSEGRSNNSVMLGLTFINNFIRIKPINGLYRKKMKKTNLCLRSEKKRLYILLKKCQKYIYEQEFHIGICQSYARNSTIAP